MVLDAPAGPLDLPRLTARLRALVETSGADVVGCDARGLPARLDSVEVLVRLQLCALRCGRRFRAHHVSPELAVLLALCGLTEVLGVAS